MDKLLARFSRWAGLVAVASLCLSGCTLLPWGSSPVSGAWAPWATPGDGTLVVIARSATTTPIPHGLEVCVSEGPSSLPLTVYVWLEGDDIKVKTGRETSINLGQCLQIDRPVAVIVQASTTEFRLRGSYRWASVGLFPPTGRVVQAQPARNMGTVSPAVHQAVAACTPLPRPTAQFWAACRVELPAIQRGVRLCVDKDYISSTDGKTEYAVSLLQTMLSRTLLTVDRPGDYDARWNDVMREGCRDFFFTEDVYFMVGPNHPGDFWDPSKVTGVKYSLTRL